MKNKSAKGLTTGTVVLILAILVGAYVMNVGGVQDWFAPSEPITPVGRCPSSGLTEITINAQEALASSATDAEVNYYVYDNSVLVKEGTTTTGTVSFDVECAANQRYQMLIVNETVERGFYPQIVTIEASDAADVHNFKMYEYGQIDISSIVGTADPTGGKNISGGAGRTCGFTVTFSNNESASGVNKPLIICRVNSTAVVDVTMSGVTEVSTKKPARDITVVPQMTGHNFYTFEYPELVLSTDAGIKVSGKVQFSSSATFVNQAINNMTCAIIDQATYQTVDYNTLSLSEGWIEAAEDETLTDVGAPDSASDYVYFGPIA